MQDFFSEQRNKVNPYLLSAIQLLDEEEQIKLLATNGMLVKRPLIVDEDKVLVGFKEAEWKEKLV